MFEPGETVKTLEFEVINDDIPENDETATIVLTSDYESTAIVKNAKQEATITIVAVDMLRYGFSRAETRVMEGAGSAEVTIGNSYSNHTMWGDHEQTTPRMLLSLGKEEDTAETDVDYDESGYVLNYPHGVEEHRVSIPIIDDDIDEGDEFFTTTLLRSNGMNPYISQIPETAIVRIIDDDTRGVGLSKSVVEQNEGETTSYEVTLTSEPTANVTMQIEVRGSSKISVSKTTLSFTPDNWSQAQTVEVSNSVDTANARNENANIVHTATGGDYREEVAKLRVKVLDAEGSQVRVVGGLARHSAVLDEGHSLDLLVKLREVSNGRRTAALALSGTATRSDIEIRHGGRVLSYPYRVTVPEGEDEVEFTLTARRDGNESEGNETLTLHVVENGSTGATATDITITPCGANEEGQFAFMSVNGEQGRGPGDFSNRHWRPEEAIGSPFTLRVCFSEPVEGMSIGSGQPQLDEGGATPGLYIVPLSAWSGKVERARHAEGRLSGLVERAAGQVWTVRVSPTGAGILPLALNVAKISRVDRASPNTSRGVMQWSPYVRTGSQRPEVGPRTMTATFTKSPFAHQGPGGYVEVFVKFNQPEVVAAVNADIGIEGGSIVEHGWGDNHYNEWRLRISPDGNERVVLTLASPESCEEGEAGRPICSSDADPDHRKPLSETLRLTIPGPADEGTPGAGRITAQFEQVPGEYYGTTVTAQLVFSKAITTAASVMRDQIVQTSHGRIISANPVGGNRARWQIRAQVPYADWVMLRLEYARECGERTSICTNANEKLVGHPVAEIMGPPRANFVEKAEAIEGTDETIDFEITLTRPVSRAAVVSYTTRDETAQRNVDYRGGPGSVRFNVGEDRKVVSFVVVDDDINEGLETFELIGTRATNVQIGNDVSLGLIRNDDPMPQAWLARFGRTVAGQAVDTIAGRLDGGGGTQVTVGGQALDFSGGSDGAMTEERREALESALGTLAGTDEEPANTSRSMTGRELLLGSAFHLSAGGEAGGPAFAAWGRFATGGFDAEEGGARMDGSVTSAFLGADMARGRWLAGLAVGVSEGEGGYANDGTGAGGDVETAMTALYPYGRVSVTDRFDVWGLAGFGEGELEMTHGHEGEAEERFRTDVGMRMGAVGVRGEVLTPAEPSGLVLAVRSDAFWVRTTSDAVRAREGAHGNLAAAQADASRLRLVVEGSRSFAAGAGTLTPSLEVGLRHDGGDAETGTGVEVGAAVRYAGEGVTVEGAVRTLVAHEESGYEEWGASGAVRIDPGMSGRGLSLTLAPSWGVASGGAERLWGMEDARALSPERATEPGRRFEAELGYGVGLGGLPGVVTPYAGLSFGEDETYAYRTGARWAVAPGAEVSVEGMRTGAAGEGDESDQALMLRGSLRW